MCAAGTADTLFHRAWECPHGLQGAATSRQQAIRQVAQRAGQRSPLSCYLWAARPCVSKPTEGLGPVATLGPRLMSSWP